MQKFISILFVAILSALTYSAGAQTYLVSEIKGSVKLINGKQKNPVKKRQALAANQVLHIPASAKVVLIDSLNQELCTIEQPCTGSIKQLIESGNVSIKKVSKQYLKYILGKLRRESSATDDSLKMQSSAHAYREGDSILVPPCDTIIPAHPCDSIE